MAFTLMLCMAGYGQSGNWKTTNNPAQSLHSSILVALPSEKNSTSPTRTTEVEAPDELKAQIPIIKQMTSFMGISTHESAGVEADDLIASAVESLRNKVEKIFIVSSDKDLAQIVGPGSFSYFLRPQPNRRSAGANWTPEV